MNTTRLPHAVGAIVLAVLALSLGDAIIKLTNANFVLWQVFVLRSIIAIPCLIIYMLIREQQSIRIPSSVTWTTIRSMLLVFTWVCYYLSLPHLPLSAAAAAFYTLPIFITLFSALMVGDSIKLTGWIAVFLGFLGVTLILKPNVEDFNWYALLPTVAAILYALAMILTGTKCQSEPPLLLSLCLNISFVVVGGIAATIIATLPNDMRHGFLLAPWSAMDMTQWSAITYLAIAIIIGSVFAAYAYQNAPSSIIGTFDFAYVGFAVIWGAVLLSETPDKIAVLGITLIVVAGVLSLRHKR